MICSLSDFENLIAEVKFDFVRVHCVEVKENKAVRIIEIWETEKLKILSMLKNCFFSEALHGAHKVHIWHKSVELFVCFVGDCV